SAEKRWATAADEYRRALTIFAKRLPDRHPWADNARTGLGSALVELRQRAEAASVLEQAVGHFDADASADPSTSAAARFALARAIVAVNPARARALARAALAIDEKIDAKEEMATVTAWLARH